ncbi:MAG: hypothetical protein V3U62_04070 [Sedimenticolaceae bacterium]
MRYDWALVGVEVLLAGQEAIQYAEASRGCGALSHEGTITDFGWSYCYSAGRRGRVVRHG